MDSLIRLHGSISAIPYVKYVLTANEVYLVTGRLYFETSDVLFVIHPQATCSSVTVSALPRAMALMD